MTRKGWKGRQEAMQADPNRGRKRKPLSRWKEEGGEWGGRQGEEMEGTCPAWGGQWGSRGMRPGSPSNSGFLLDRIW